MQHTDDVGEEEAMRRAAMQKYLNRTRSSGGVDPMDFFDDDDDEDDDDKSNAVDVAGAGDDTVNAKSKKRPASSVDDDDGSGDSGAGVPDMMVHASGILAEMEEMKSKRLGTAIGRGTGALGATMSDMSDADRLAAMIPTDGAFLQRTTRRKSRKRGDRAPIARVVPDEERFARHKLTVYSVGSGEPRNMFYLTVGEVLSGVLAAWDVQPLPPIERATVPPSWAYVFNRARAPRTPSDFPTRPK